MASRRGFLLAAIYGIVAASLPLAVLMLKPGKPQIRACRATPGAALHRFAGQRAVSL